MNKTLSNIAIYLTSLYLNAPIDEIAVGQIATHKFPIAASRFEILTIIDEYLKMVDVTSTIDVVRAIEVMPLDNQEFQVKFTAGQAEPDVKVNGGPTNINGLFDLLKSVTAGHPDISIAGPFQLPTADEIDEGMNDEYTIMDELQVVTTAIDLITRIEQHALCPVRNTPNPMVNTAAGFTSALTKYIPAIEKAYLQPYLKVVTIKKIK